VIGVTDQILFSESIGGVYVDGACHAGRGKPLPLVDPSTGECFAVVATGDAADVDDAVEKAEAAATGWGAMAPVERGRVCLRVAELLRTQIESLAALVVQDAGLPVSLARRDVEAAARYFEFYAGVGDKLGGESIPVGPGAIDFTMREPWGVCAVVLPFNFPLQLAARDLAPALAMGNAVVLKPPEQDPLAALALAAVCAEAGVPNGAVTAVTGLGVRVGEALVRHRGVDHITFTGSAAAARLVLQQAAVGVKPATVELGGKSPHIVFADADIGRAAASIVTTTFRAAGQACSAGTRVLVEESLEARFMDELVNAAAALRVGPAIEDPDVGPLISEKQRDAVFAAISVAKDEGARLALGGGTPMADGLPAGGFYVAPTVLADVARTSAAAREEIFGPVVSVLRFAGEEAAVELADETEFGLVAGVWTRDIGRAVRVARQVKAGQVFVNGYGVGGGAELPFGGYKRSGYGRVKGLAGALEYTQLKNVWISCE
jgi:aldehyde dehydrogenase (NAD+)